MCSAGLPCSGAEEKSRGVGAIWSAKGLTLQEEDCSRPPGSRVWCLIATGAEPEARPDVNSTAEAIPHSESTGRRTAAARPQAEGRELPASYFAEMAEVKHRYGLSSEAVQLYRQALQLVTDPQQRLQYQLPWPRA